MNKQIITLIGIASAAALSAQTVVNFGGSGMVAEGVDLGNPGSVLTASAISPGSGYTGQTFYGGSVGTGVDVAVWRINTSGSGALGGLNHVRLSAPNPTPFTGAGNNKFQHGVLFFKQADFLMHSMVPGGVTLNGSTPLSFTAKRVAGSPSRIGYVLQTSQPGNPYFVNFIDYDDNNLTTVDGDGNTVFGQGHRYDLADPTTVTWHTFNPDASLSSIGAEGTPDFGAVTGIGVWFENERSGIQTSTMVFQVGEISFTAVPEPSTYAALFGALALGIVMYRRRRG